jgi:hypothetical protein
MSRAPSRPRWLILLRPRWLGWHAFAAGAAVGMLWLGDWQLHRAEAGNELSWAYTFEWPLFTVLGIAFWVRTVREELRSPGPASDEPDEAGPATGAGALPPARRAPPARPPDDPAAYAARLTAEVRRHGRWHGLR